MDTTTDVDLQLYAPFEGLHGTEPVPLVAAIPFYADPEMTDAIGTLTIVGVTVPYPDVPTYFWCDIAFGWHEPSTTLAGARDMLMMTGAMIQGDPRSDEPMTPDTPFLQLFTITGGTGKYLGASGQATIDPSLSNQGYQIVFG